METYSPIGRYQISVDGRIFVATQCGPFNLAYAMDFVEHSRPLIAALDASGSFATLTIYRESMVYSPDALDYILNRARLVDRHRRNCVAQAIVAELGVHGVATMRPAVDRFFADRGMRADSGRFLVDESEARQWLATRLEKPVSPT